MRKIDEIIIHCSATIEGKNFTVKDIDRWHKDRGFSKIGYHYVIYLDGSVHPGRPVEDMGAHCVGHNASTIGICYIGGLNGSRNPKDTRTLAQRKALITLVKELKNKYNIKKVSGHNQYAKKACPCFDVTKEF